MRPLSDIAIIGSGNLAEALAAAVARTEGAKLRIAARNSVRGREIAAKCGAQYVDPQTPLTGAELCIIAVSDAAIESVAEWPGIPAEAIVAHTSGATPLLALPQRFARRGVIYPLQTFTAGRQTDFASIPIFTEGSDELTAEALEAFAQRLSRCTRRADSQSRRMIHLAAVFACNFTNALYGIGARMMERAGFGFDELRPLIAETAAKALEAQNPPEVQTGPAVRGDMASMQRHMELLKQEARLSEIYKLLSDEIWETSKRI